MNRIAIASFKGGVGKTTVAVNLAVVLARRFGRKVLLVDTDPSANVTAHFPVRPGRTLYELLMGDGSAQAVMTRLPDFGELFLIASCRATQAAEFKLAVQIGRERVLESRLAGLDGFDYLLIDTAPSVSILAQNALVCARHLLIPVSMDPLSLLGASSAVGIAAEIQEKLGIESSVFGFVPTFVDQRLVMNRLVLEALAERYPGIPILPGIRSDVMVKKASAMRKPLLEVAAASRACQDFERLAEAVESRCFPRRKAANL